MNAWRIVRSVYADDPLSGAGAAHFGGRWNSIGTAMVYTSTSRPLAVLEMLVHVRRGRASLDLILVPLKIPDDLVTELQNPPDGWNEIPHCTASCQAGDRWIENSHSLGLLVPSVVLPAERNLLINPVHAQIGKIRIGQPEIRAFDKRLFVL